MMKNINKQTKIVRQVRFASYLRLGLLLLCLSAVSGVAAQQGEASKLNLISFKGTVRDANSQAPIVAAQVRALNSNVSAVTDTNGVFNLALTSATDVLLISAYDYSLREIAVRGQNSLDVELFPDVFTPTSKTIKGISGEVRYSHMPQSVRGIDNVGYSTALTVDEMIQTRLGGDVRAINRSGLAAIGSSLFIRGYNSLNLNSQPLFVVDGVIWNNLYDAESVQNGYFGNTLADIDINDIENVTVLKDGTSIYGSKGSNGVIVIQTKRGKNMATVISVNAMLGFTNAPESLPTMTGDQFRIYASDLIGTQEFDKESIGDLGFLVDDPSRSIYPVYHNNTNWDDQIYQMGKTQSYNVGVNGGDAKALYNFALGYTSNQGVVKTTDMERLNLRFNGDFNLTNTLDLGMNIGFTNIARHLLDDGVNFYTSPTYLAMIKSPFFSPYQHSKSGGLTNLLADSDMFNVGNPLAVIENASNRNSQYRMNVGMEPTLKLTPHLTLSTLIDYSLDKVKEVYYSPLQGAAVRYLDGYGFSYNMAQSQQNRNIALFDETKLSYSRLFEGGHRLNVLAGWRYLSNFYEMDFVEGHNTGTDQKKYVQYAQDYIQVRGINNSAKSISNFANLDYSFANRYFLSGALAVDGSSRFGKETIGGFQMFDRSWGVFPSVNAAWLVSSEKFMKGAGFVDQLKLRAGYGLSGNDDMDCFAWSSYFNSERYMGRANGLVIGQLGNEEIQWETAYKTSLGIDAILLNEHLSVSADFYKNRTKNLLGLKSYPEITGLGYYWSNDGELSNEGYEVSATIKVLNSKSIKWEVGGSVGHYQNEVVSLPDGDFSTQMYDGEIRTMVGKAAGVFYGYKTNGVFATRAEAEAANLKIVDAYGVESYFEAGDMCFVDNGDGIINEADKKVIGDPNPDIYGSFTSKIGYKNLTLDALFTYSYGNDVYNYLRAKLESGKNYSNQTTSMLTRWTAEGQQTEMPKAVYGDPMGNARFSDRWIEDGSYLKLKSLSLNYKLPLKTSAIENVNVWVAATNLWTLTNYLGRDPEVSAGNGVLFQGIDAGLLPSNQSILVGVKFNL